ncbi:hypothetical protein DPMN_145236 [Dreissena polymorpha]|uniref:Uncharacterized protein n=1 Tax=Dreissena polymorpha TaxID=45954 RepID=A0A9D4F5L1_DREPO|nr:hypothetical protein DPMN_145236 [Dreissena polymorpha]
MRSAIITRSDGQYASQGMKNLRDFESFTPTSAMLASGPRRAHLLKQRKLCQLRMSQ